MGTLPDDHIDLKANAVSDSEEERWSSSPFNPYVGLRPFFESDVELFFGRSEHVDELLTRLKGSRFIAVVGTSGSGKSSLVRAGLIPRLKAGRMLGKGSSWRIATFRPEDKPIRKLAIALWRTLNGHEPVESEMPLVDALEDKTRSSSFGLVDAIREAQLPPNHNLLLVVDQFEEVFRYGEDRDHDARHRQSGVDSDGILRERESRENEAEAFVRRLLMVSREANLAAYVLITMRSEFLGDCARAEGLPEAVNNGLYLIPRLTRLQLTDAIRNPLAMREGSISDPLVQRLLNEVSGEQDQLPVLQHALMRAWQGPKRIDAGDFDKVGGTANALSKHASKIWKQLSDRGQDTAERLFRCITKPGPDEKGLRRPVHLSQVAEVTGQKLEELKSVIEAFRARGSAFLMPPVPSPLRADSKEDTVIDISHESLIRKWDKLRDWIKAESKSGEAYERLLQLLEYQESRREPVVLQDWEVRYFVKHKIEDHWNRNWAKRYGGRYREAVIFLRKSQLALRRKLQKEKEAEALKIQNGVLRKFAIGLGVSVLVIAVGCLLLGMRWLRDRTERTAESLAGKSEQEASQYGRATQELAALYSIDSAALAHVPANSNISGWEAFLRITKGEKLAPLYTNAADLPYPGVLSNKVDRLFISDERSIRPDRALIVFDRLPDSDARSIAVINLKDKTLAQDEMRALTDSLHGNVTAVSSSGRYLSGECRDSKANIVETSTGNTFSVTCDRTIRIIADSSGSNRFATVESERPVSDEILVRSTIHVWEKKPNQVRKSTERPTLSKPILDVPSILLMNIALSPDGQDIAWVSTDQVATPDKGQLHVRKIVGGGRDIGANDIAQSAPISFSYDSDLLVAGARDGKVYLYERARREPTWVDKTYLAEHVGTDLPPSFSDLSSPTKSSRKDSKSDVRSIQFLIPKHNNAIPNGVSALAFANHSYMLASSGADGFVRVTLIDSKATSSVILWSDSFLRGASQLVFSPTDMFLGMAMGENTARVKYSKTGVETARVTHKSRVKFIAFSSHEATFSVSDGFEGDVLRFSPRKTTETDEMPASADLDCDSPKFASQDTDGKTIAASCSSDSSDPTDFTSGKVPVAKIFIVDKERLGEERVQEIGTAKGTNRNAVCQVAVSWNGAVAASVCDFKKLTLFDIASSRAVKTEMELPTTAPAKNGPPCNPVSLALNSDGTKLGVGDLCGIVRIFSTDGLRAKSTLDLYHFDSQIIRPSKNEPNASPVPSNGNMAITSLAFSEEATMIAVGMYDGSLSVIGLDNRKGTFRFSTPPAEGKIGPIQFSTSKSSGVDSSELIFGAGPTTTVLRANDGEQLISFSGKSTVKAVALTPDLDFAASGGDDGSIAVFDLANSPGRLQSWFLKLATHHDPLPAPNTTLSAMPGWIRPPTTSSPSPQSVYALRFLNAETLIVASNQPRALEPVDRGNTDPILSFTVRKLNLSDVPHLKSLCKEIREDLLLPSDIDYTRVCTNTVMNLK